MKTLREYIRVSGRSVQELADKIEVAPSTLYRALNHKTELKLSTLLKLSKETGIKVEILIQELKEAGEKKTANGEE